MDININKLAKEIHQQNVKAGWWDGKQCIYTKLQLVSSEIAEATEAERKDLMDSHLPHRKGGEVELADALIRVLDLGGYMNLQYECGFNGVLQTMNSRHSKSKTIPEHHFWINNDLCIFSMLLDKDQQSVKDPLISTYRNLINGILYTAERAGYDIWGALSEKLEYNRKRLDHKRSERAKEGGKKF